MADRQLAVGLWKCALDVKERGIQTGVVFPASPIGPLIATVQNHFSNFMSRLQATSAVLKDSSNVLAGTTDASLHNHRTP